MKERPILMCGEMVRAVLAGTKTQTRRVIKPQPKDIKPDWYPDRYNKTADWTFWGPRKTDKSGCCTLPMFRCPHGEPGQRLWVKETWATSLFCDGRPPSDMEKPGRGYGWPVWYAADGAINLRGRNSLEGGIGFTTKGKTRQSIFMPRWASRITLEIVSVRVERVQEISENDAKAEGVECPRDGENCSGYVPTMGPDEPAECVCIDGYVPLYKALWDSINAKTHPWASDPWVWVLEFRKL